jgi:uncharacterized protein
VTIVDANVLLHAIDRAAPEHDVAKGWLDAALSGHETVALPWLCLLAFVRIATHPGIFRRPLTIAAALDVVEGWTARPNVITPHVDRHVTRRLRHLLESAGVGGNLVNDAFLAAIALDADATVVTFDRDFERFAGLRVLRLTLA